MDRLLPNTSRVWWALAVPPLLFLVIIAALSFYFGAITHGDPQAIAGYIASSIPAILLIVQIGLLLVLFRAIWADRLPLRALGWQLSNEQTLWHEVLIGLLVGLPLGLLYVFVLSPLLTAVQNTLGDYVPPGQLLPSLGTELLAFFVANVVLAPFVEESLYRGYAIPRLVQRWGVVRAILISCVFFGLLHWTGGFWYTLLTGVVAGGLLSGLFVWRRSIVSAYTAHLLLNLVEFVFIWLGV